MLVSKHFKFFLISTAVVATVLIILVAVCLIRLNSKGNNTDGGGVVTESFNAEKNAVKGVAEYINEKYPQLRYTSIWPDGVNAYNVLVDGSDVEYKVYPIEDSMYLDTLYGYYLLDDLVVGFKDLMSTKGIAFSDVKVELNTPLDGGFDYEAANRVEDILNGRVNISPDVIVTFTTDGDVEIFKNLIEEREIKGAYTCYVDENNQTFTVE